MVRGNGKELILDYDRSIKKSNELSMAKLNSGLSLNQMQLLAFAIFSTQRDGKTEFQKIDFEKQFDVQYKTQYAKEDVKRVSRLQFSIEDLDNEVFEYWNIFQSIRYDCGTFSFRWNEEFIPHILDLKERYVTTDLNVTSNFKSEFSWVLYEYLKAHYGFWRKVISKNALMRLFGVEERPTYQKNTSRFKKSVLDVAIEEIKTYTELDVWYKEEKKGRSIVGFEIYWSTGKRTAGATKKQIMELKALLDAIEQDGFELIDNLDGVGDRSLLADILRECAEMKGLIEGPIEISKERADYLVNKFSSYFRKIHNLSGKSKAESRLVFYDWLNEK